MSGGANGTDYGYLGIFSNVRVALVDAQSRAVLAEDIATIGETHAASRAPDRNPMNALTSAEKVTRLGTLLGSAIAKVLPGLLAKSVP
jgi:hypothetical protein